MVSFISEILWKSEIHRNRTEKWLPGAGGGALRERLVKGYKWIRSEDLIYNVVTIVDNTILHNWNLMRVRLKCSHQEKKKMNMWGDG